ncbi:MAG: hypothetical protein IKZ82_02395 [Clostridia bacterium]|nr:hypothetical protein [Clostridia bacterium]
MGEYLCWAACLTSAVKYITGVNVKQAAFPRFLFNGEILDLPVPAPSIELCLDHWGINWSFNPGPISFSGLKATIQNGRPGFAVLFFSLAALILWNLGDILS